MTDVQLGLHAFREGRMREAADRLQSALGETELSTSQVVRYETCAYLGAALYALGLPAEAVTAFELAFQFSPSSVPPEDLMMNLAHAYLASGRRDAAREVLSFLLSHVPGHVAATMLALRLDSSTSESDITGAVLGTSPDTVHNYIRTLRFTQLASGGYDPAQVHEVLSQLERFINNLSRQQQEAETKIAQHELEILRYREMEDAVVENIVQMQKNTPPSRDAAVKSELSPIEILFQQKP
ncbi:MAG: DivIVA domain-containing protein [Janthinobacterium lividum]